MEKKLKVASLFCGIGGSDLGMIGGFDYMGKHYEELPFDVSYAIDFDKHAVATYNQNFTRKATCADITQVDFNTLPDVDIMVGGFPCQSFSTANTHKDINDARANLYKQVVRFLQEKQPKYFICENVKGLLTLQGGKVLEKIINEFSECGYNVQYKLLKAVEYGIPQRRERLFIVGIRNDIQQTYEYPSPICTQGNYVAYGGLLEDTPIAAKYYFSEVAVNGSKKRNNGKIRIYPPQCEPCFTITSHLSKSTIGVFDPVLLVDGEKEIYRRLTPREAARIQSFPDTYVLAKSDTQAYKQIGNAIPPVLMWYVAKQLCCLF